jgi:hypothetical protein
MTEQDDEPRPPGWFMPLVCAALGVVALGMAALAGGFAG